MTTVDDLVISLRIDESSNLGKLQKQLKALVGDKGDKKVELGLDLVPSIKRDLLEIKADLLMLTPTVLTSGETVRRSALALTNQVRTQEGVKDAILERYSMEEDRLNEFVEELLNVSSEDSKLNNEQQKRFVAEMQKFITITNMSEGERKTIVTKIIGMLSEVSILQQKVQDSFRAAGVGYRGQYQVYRVTKKSIDNQFSEQIAHYEKADKTTFDKLKAIFKDQKDPLRAMEEAYDLMLDVKLNVEQLDRYTIQSVDELKMILVAQIAASLKDSTYMLEDFYKAGKLLTGGKRFGVGGPKKLDLVVAEGLKQFFDEHGGTVVFGQLTDVETNILTELKTVATKQSIEKTVQERINQGFTRIVLVAEEIKDTAIDAAKELLSKEIYKDISLAMVQILPRAISESTGTAKDLEAMHEASTKEVKEEIAKVAEKMADDMEDFKYDKETREADQAQLKNFLDVWEEDKDETGVTNDKMLEFEKKQAEQMEKALKDLEEIKKNTGETNKNVKPDPNAVKVEPEDKE